MEDKKLSGYPVYTDEDADITNVVSSGELTGLQPRLPVYDNEVESYAWLYNGSPRSMDVLEDARKRAKPDNKKEKPKIILPL